MERKRPKKKKTNRDTLEKLINSVKILYDFFKTKVPKFINELKCCKSKDTQDNNEIISITDQQEKYIIRKSNSFKRSNSLECTFSNSRELFDPFDEKTI